MLTATQTPNLYRLSNRTIMKKLGLSTSSRLAVSGLLLFAFSLLHIQVLPLIGYYVWLLGYVLLLLAIYSAMRT